MSHSDSDDASFHSQEEGESNYEQNYKLHYLIWEQDYSNVAKYIRSDEFEMYEFERIDPRGRTPLHLAISLGLFEIARLLLSSGANPTSKNAGGWSALHEAVSTGDPELVIEILVNRMSFRKQMEVLGRNAIMKHFFNMDNIYLEMKWEITSIIPLVGRFCPSDTMRLWKSGNHIRVDFSLVGIEKLSWQRGNRSILVAFDKNSAPGQEGQIVEIDHDEKTSKIEAWSTGSDITGDKVTPKNPRFTNLDGAQKMKLEKAVQHRLTNPIRLTSIEPTKIKIEKAQSGVWGFQSDRIEKISTYDCQVYNITGVELLQRLRTEHCEANDPKVIKENVEKASSERNELWGSMFGISKNTKITDQNESEFKTQYNPDGLTAAEYFNPSASNKNDVGRPQVIKERRQNFKGQTWNTEESPISLKEQLIPIFDILCNFNDLPWFESLRQMLKLIPSGFPVRIDVPLFYVLTARVTFQNINSLEGDGCSQGPDGKLKIEDRIFDLPSGYTTTYSNLNENIRKNKERSRQNNQEMDLAINQSLMENLGISGSQNEEMQRQLAESQRAAQLEFNSRLDEEAALEEAIKRSLQH